MALTNTLFGEWDIPGDVAALDVDEVDDGSIDRALTMRGVTTFGS